MGIIVTTVAGGGKVGFEDGKAENAAFEYPHGVCVSNDGDIYISDSYHHSIRMVSDGIVSLVAGYGKAGFEDGEAKNAKFSTPTGICISDNGKIYVADNNNSRIRMISDGIVSTIAGCGQKGYQDGEAKNAKFFFPLGICVSKDGKIYLSDYHNHCIRMISDGIVSTIAGCGIQGFQDGDAKNAKFDWPKGICLSNDSKIYVSDSNNNRIRMISNGLVTTIAGNGKEGSEDGEAENATFQYPHGICVSDHGDIYVSIYSKNRIRLISDGIVSTIAGSGVLGFQDGDAKNAMFNGPTAMCISNSGELYVADTNNKRIRMISGLQSSSTAFQYFELSSLIDSNLLSDMTLTINNHQYKLHTAVIHSLCPMLAKNISVINHAKISHQSLTIMFEIIYSNNTKKIRKQQDQYSVSDLTQLVELVWLLESFNINNQLLVTGCTQQFKTELKYLIKHEKHKSTIETVKNDLICKIRDLITLNDTHTLATTQLVQILNHLIDQNNNQSDNQQHKTTNNNDDTDNNANITMSMHDMYVIFGLCTEPSVVDEEQVQSQILQLKQTTLKQSEMTLATQPDYTIMTHDRSYSIRCHKLILCGKWSYFRRLIESGLSESRSGEMIMSEDWNARRLYDFVKYLYTHKVGFESMEDAFWLLENAELYELMESSEKNEESKKNAKKDYELLIGKCRKRTTRDERNCD